MKLAWMVAVAHLGCASAPPPHQINPAVSTQLVSSEPPRAMGGSYDPSDVQTTSAELRSEQPKPAPAPRRR